MPEQVQKQKTSQARKAEAETQAKQRSEEAQKLLDDTDAILDEIDSMVAQGELVDALTYEQRGGQ